ncbi:hypothetical protein ACF07L_34895 [Streptomyces anulatus]|uniref:hypothetical protein n=1 Tax=Streptomyces anulatus TaxID=1892 RepID=UPI0037018C46
MKQLLALYQYAAGLNRRTLTLGIIGTIVALGLGATAIWAPVERATLVLGLVSPVLAAVAAAVILDWWNRRRV